MDDLIDEEKKIMEERDKSPTVLKADIFMQPISNLNLPTITPVDISGTISDALEIMQKFKIGAVIVTNKGKVAGIFTERDLLLKVAGIIDDLETKSITKVMTPDPVRLLKDDKIAYVMHNMHVGRFRHIPIVNENDEPISIVSIRKINSFILDHFPEEITNITESPHRMVSQRNDA